MGDSTMQVLEMYRQAGLDLSGDFLEVPDHIAAELEFLSFLVSKELEIFHRGDREEAFRYLEMQREFLDQYLRPWVDPFADKIRAAAGHDFYRLLASCLSTFVMKTPVPETLPDPAGTQT